MLLLPLILSVKYRHDTCLAYRLNEIYIYSKNLEDNYAGVFSIDHYPRYNRAFCT